MRRYRIVRLWHELEKVNQDFYDNTTDELTLIEPKLTLAMNENGSLEFTMPVTHKYFSTVSPMADEFMVIDTIKDEVMFIGRPISCKVNDFKTLEVYCEGAMGYLHDILVRPEEWDNTTPKRYFTDLINRHNTIKTQHVPYQEIKVGTCTIPDRDIYRTCNYESVYDAMTKGCLDTDGGYFIMTYGEDGSKTLNWYRLPPQISGERQKVRYGENIVSYEEGYDLSGRGTVILPLGAETETELPGGLGKAKVVGDIYAYALTGDQVSKVVREHGYIEEVREYSEAKSKSEILKELRRDRIVGEMNLDYQGSLDCKVADLYFLDNGINSFYVGQYVDLENIPNSTWYNRFNDLIYVKKIEYNLESAAPVVTVGVRDKQNLSDQFKKTNDQVKNGNNSRSNFSGGTHSGSGSESGMPLYHTEYGDVLYPNELGEAAPLIFGNTIEYVEKN